MKVCRPYMTPVLVTVDNTEFTNLLLCCTQYATWQRGALSKDFSQPDSSCYCYSFKRSPMRLPIIVFLGHAMFIKRHKKWRQTWFALKRIADFRFMA